MRIPLRIFIPLLLLIIPVCARSQKSDQTLLWRITGKGLPKPSYLFGTMHLTDKRLFRFDDSVYAAIENTEGLAIEINLNEMLGYYVNKLLDEKADDKKLKDLLSEAELKKLKEPLSKKFNKDINDISTKDILKEKNKWMEDYVQTGEMPTFIDAYLYDIARRQGKWLGGIEDVEDQMSLIDGGELNQLVAGDKKITLDSMIHLYVDEDLEGINIMFNGYDPRYRDLLLTKRNVKMARRMDSLSAFRPMFFAVGAGHLPGDSGVINLLKARGFTVEPVFSKTKIFAEDYKYKEVPTAWYEVTDEQNLYTVSMPGQPSSIKIYGLIEMKFLLDLSNLSGFCTMAFVSPGDESNDDTVYHRLAARIFKKGNVKPPKRISKDGMSGVEYFDREDKYLMRLQLFHKGNITYMAWVYGKKEAYLRTEEADKFFGSLKFKAQKTNVTKIYNFTDPAMGISFNAPAKVELNTSLTKTSGNVKGWDIAFYSGQDPISGAYIMLVSKQARAGNYIADDSTVLEEISGYFKEKYKVEKKWATIDGYHALTMEGGADDVYMKVLTFVRGNKNIAIMLVTRKKNEDPDLEAVFTSLQLLPYEQATLQTAYDPRHTFSAMVPVPFRSRKNYDESVKLGSYYSFDTLTGTSFNVSTDTLNKYTWATDDFAFLSKKIQDFLNDGERTVYERMTKNGTDISIETLIQKAHSNVYKRMRIVVHGNIQYNLFAGGDKQVLTGPNADKFFSQFKAVGTTSFNLDEYKGRMLIHDLASKDSATRGEAYRASWKQDFTKEDLPMLHKALFQHYQPLYSRGDETLINQRIGSSIGKVGDRSSVLYVKENYERLKGEKENMKYIALTMLADIKTQESYEAIADLIVSSPPRQGDDYVFSRRMKDSLLLLKRIYPTLAKVVSDTSMGTVIAGFAYTLFDSGLINIEELKKSEHDFVRLAGNLLPSYQKENNYDVGIYDILHLLFEINTPATLNELQQYLSVKNIFLRRKAAILLTERDQKLPGAIWDTLAAWPETRALTYNELKKIVKEFLFPQAYLTQKYFAESAMYDAATENDEVSYSSMEIISTRAEKYKGSMYKFYLYKVNYIDGNDTVTYLGVAGGYDLIGKSLDAEKSIAGIYWKEQYNRSKLNEQFDAFIEQYEGNEEKK